MTTTIEKEEQLLVKNGKYSTLRKTSYQDSWKHDPQPFIITSFQFQLPTVNGSPKLLSAKFQKANIL